MDYKLIAEVAAKAGTIMLESQAESYRVEDTVRHILNISGLASAEVFANTTGLFITLDDPSIEPITLIRRISHRGTHLRKIYRVNNISRQLTNGQITPQEAMTQLEYVEEAEYNVLSKSLSTFILIISFSILLGGTWAEVLFAELAAGIVLFARLLQKTLNMNDFIYGVVTTAMIAFLVSFTVHSLRLSLSIDIIIVSGLMPLFPGTAFTNGIRDTLKGDYSSGIAKIAEALVISFSLALGVAIGLYFSLGGLRV